MSSTTARPVNWPIQAGHAVVMLLACAEYFLFFRSWPLIPDNAWLLDATGRWLGGARLYLDLVEINPPLVFYEMAAFTLGTATKPAFVASVCALVAVSALWVSRLAGLGLGWASLAAIALGGFTDFGQREHIALICVIPYLLAPTVNRREAIALGLFAFLGVGLKPHLLAMPAFATLATCLVHRSWRPIFAPANLAIGVACVAYFAAAVVLHPAYFSQIVPLGQFVYFAYGRSSIFLYQFPLFAAMAALLAMTLMQRRELEWRVAAALVGALLSYAVQAKWWSYHFVPAAGLTLLLAGMLAVRETSWLRRGPALILVVSSVVAIGSKGPPAKHPGSVVPPPDVRSVLFLSPHVFAAYPASFGGRIHQVSRYPALWPIPGAWGIATDPHETPVRRARARAVLAQTRANIVSDVVTGRPDMILADDRRVKQYFVRPFDWLAFMERERRFARYVETGRIGWYRVLRPVEPGTEVASRSLDARLPR